MRMLLVHARNMYVEFFFVKGVCCYEHYVCLLLLHRFQGIAWIGCLCVREFTAVFFIDECACLFIALLACISAQGRLYGIVRAYGSLSNLKSVGLRKYQCTQHQS